ncbi:MAG: hypothetical protein HND55_14525 [Pseudomonadota bacterium]|nr:MAG: hypothetical protein HND55_14525 [Pseudomonadota bacterium]
MSLIFLATAPAMAWVSVGSSPGFGTCTYTSIQDALDDGDTEIRILDNQDFVENVTISGSRSLRGGFSSCLAAALNQQLGSNATIDGSGSNLLPTVFVTTSSTASVTLENLTIIGGSVGVHTGGMDGALTVRDSLIGSNSGFSYGGGISVGNPGDLLQVIIRNSSIIENQSDYGGGIYCASANGLIRLESGAIADNFGAVDGGGVYLDNGCAFSSYAGSRFDDVLYSGILRNMTAGDGGGIYAAGGATVNINGHFGPYQLWGNNTDPATVAENSAGSDGGGIYAVGSETQVELLDALVRDNTADNRGGGAYVGSTASLTADLSGDTCWDGWRCSQWLDNSADGGGAHYGGHLAAYDGASVQLSRTHMGGGRAALGTALYASGLFTQLALDGSFLTGNGLASPGNDENYVIGVNAGASAELKHVTVSGNQSSAAALGANGTTSELTIRNSIVWHPTLPVLAATNSPVTTFDCVVVNENGSTGAGGVEVANPAFRNTVAGDYRLGAGSPAIDFCAGSDATASDVEHHSRGIDEPGSSNGAGLFDAGADEYLMVDALFSDRFAE